ncbi:ATP-grasp domain-containing protein [Vibrio cholerae]|nr:ATP-grasp domain-containing protein [Vibrio cholerae]EGR5448325.1 ATP-grasp domain-containing protein [Vibrio cholerae]EGR5456668.1 ATP-grasp domain-containing protein [Vibrio cholerae]EGR5464304.1 ATP-grasp domain-containing protein [Vibrio cholerae]ELH4196077.1 ATP-grasp domain-containing protein [Vibrio cholerae]
MINLFQKDTIVVVGGFSSGNHIAPLFSGLGFNCVHVCTEENKEHPLLKPTFNPSNYSENHVLTSEAEADDFVRKMSQHRVRAVIAGCEPCVEFADKLSEKFDTPRNDFSLSQARRSKFRMHETLHKNGLKSARQILTSDIDEIINFYKMIGGQVVLKPEASSNTDGVFYCNSEQQIHETVDKILGVKNYLGIVNSKVLVQEYLSGKQYLVNTVSSNGYHYVCDAWVETRYNDEAPSNDSHADFVTVNSDIYHELADYTEKVLNALGIRYGAAHLELRMTDEGPCLVEVAARMSGNVDFSVLYDLNSLTQLSLLPDALLDTESFIKRINCANSSKKLARKVYLSSSVEGHVRNDPNLELFLDIDSVRSVSFRIGNGDYLYKTDRSQGKGRPGYLYMVASSQEKIKCDYDLVRNNEVLLYKMMLRVSEIAQE